MSLDKIQAIANLFDFHLQNNALPGLEMNLKAVGIRRAVSELFQKENKIFQCPRPINHKSPVNKI